MIVLHVNTSIMISRDGHRLHFPFATDEARSLEEVHHLLQTRGSVFGSRLTLERDGDGSIITAETAAVLTLSGVSLIQDWTRGPVRRVDP